MESRACARLEPFDPLGFNSNNPANSSSADLQFLTKQSETSVKGKRKQAKKERSPSSSAKCQSM